MQLDVLLFERIVFVARLIDVAKIVESSDRLKVSRFEPVMFSNKPTWVLPLLPTIQRYNPGIDRDTALQYACTSYGLFQILGVNIYDKGYKQTVFDFVVNENDQEAIYSAFVSAKGFDPNENVTSWPLERLLDYATFYNGPANPEAYVSAMEIADKQLS
jgi:hypothetical protein